MRRLFLSLLAVVMLHNAAAAEDLLVAIKQPPRIETYEIDAANGGIKLKSTVVLPGAPGPMAMTNDKSRLYVAIRIPGEKGKRATSGVATLSRSKQGELKVLHSATLPAFPTYLSIDATGRWLFTAHYSEGQCGVIPVHDTIAQGQFSQVVKTEKTAHCIVLDKTNRFAFAPHTNPNKVFQFRIDAKAGKLIANDPASVDGPDEDHMYHQPRHIDFHPTQKTAYTANERGGGLSVWDYDSASGTLKLAQTLTSLPAGFTGRSAAADVHVSANGKFVYVSNRDLSAKNTRGTLAGYSIDAKTGRAKATGIFKTGVVPRSFVINHSSQFVYVGGQNSNDITTHRIDQKTGQLSEVATRDAESTPIWLMCVD